MFVLVVVVVLCFVAAILYAMVVELRREVDKLHRKVSSNTILVDNLDEMTEDLRVDVDNVRDRLKHFYTF